MFVAKEVSFELFVLAKNTLRLGTCTRQKDQARTAGVWKGGTRSTPREMLLHARLLVRAARQHLILRAQQDLVLRLGAGAEALMCACSRSAAR